MRKIILLIGVLMTSLAFVACSDSDDNNVVTRSDLPQTAQEFLTKYLSQTDYTIYKDNDGSYDVRSGNYKIEFNNTGGWDSFDGKQDQNNYKAIPASFVQVELPATIVSQLSSLGTLYIVEVDKEYDNGLLTAYEIELSDGRDLKFDAQGNLISGQLPGGDSSATLPQVAQAFLTKYFPSDAVFSYERDNDSYDVVLKSGFRVDFNLLGVWDGLNGKPNNAAYIAVPNRFITAELPSKLVSQLANLGTLFVVEVDKSYSNGQLSKYEIELSDGRDLKFDTQGNLLEGQLPGGSSAIGLPQTAQTFLTKYFPSDAVFSYEIDNDSYDVVLQSGFKIEFDLQGVWDDLDGKPNHNGAYIAVPNSFMVAELPVKLTSQLSNLGTLFVVEVDKDYSNGLLSKYDIELNDGRDLEFDTLGNLLKGQLPGGSSTTGLPQAAQAFLTKYFPSDSVFTYKIDNDGYDVVLQSGFKIEFDLLGVWDNLDSRPNNAAFIPIPTTFLKEALPASIMAFIERQYPTLSVIEVDKEYKNGRLYSYDIRLSNNLEIDFDINGSILGGGGAVVTELPQAAKTFLAQHFSGLTYTQWLDGNEIDVIVGGKYKVEFDINGDWLEVDGKLYNSIVKLPESFLNLQTVKTMNDYVKTNYSNNYIIEVSKDYDNNRFIGYDVELNNLLDLEFDINGNFVRIDM